MAVSHDRTSLLAVGAIASGGAAIIHAAAAGAHAEHTALARVFVVLAVAQAAAAAAGLLRDDRWSRATLATVNGFAVGGWIASRLIGISWIEGLEVAEAPHLADTAAALLGLVAVSTSVLFRASALPSLDLSVAAALAAVAVVSGLAGTISHDHDHDDTSGALSGVDGPPGGPEVVRSDGELPASEVDAIIELGATGAGPPPDHDHGPLYTPVEVVEADRDDLDAELAFASSVVADFDTVEEAAALGYVMATAPSPGIGTHWVKWSLILEPFDLRRPSMLLFDHDRSPAPLVGFSYAVQSESAPEGFTGESDEWHRHAGLCVNLDGWVVRERAAGPEACDGSFIAGGDFWMLHAWVVPGWGNRVGVFAPMNPKLCPPELGTPDFLRCPDNAGF